MAEDTIFSKILTGEIPSEEVYSDDEFYAFKDINPAAPVHILIIPRRQIESIIDAADTDAGLLGRMLLAANKVVERTGLAETGFRYVINCGHHGGQEVKHVHMHIVGGRPLGWPPG